MSIMEDKNLTLMDSIMQALTGDAKNEWNVLLLHDPMIIAANERFNAVLERVRDLLPEDISYELDDAYAGGLAAIGDAGILFGIHTADAIRDVASRPADLSRHILERIGGGM